MRRHRFHVPDVSGKLVTVTGAEAKHATSVLRLKPGDEVVLFDGIGAEAKGVIQSIDAGSMVVSIQSRTDRVQASPTASVSLIIATAIPKGARADWMIEKCAELGVSELQPIHFARFVVEPGVGKLERWRRLAVAAAKQCGVARTMTIREPLDFKSYLSSLGSAIGLCGMPDPQGRSLAGELMAVGRDPERVDPVVIFVGPEGGLDENEMTSLIAAGVTPVTWAQTVLRVETAVVAAAAVFAAHSTGCRSADD